MTQNCSCDVVEQPNFDRPDCKSGARKSTVNTNLWMNDVQRLLSENVRATGHKEPQVCSETVIGMIGLC